MKPGIDLITGNLGVDLVAAGMGFSAFQGMLGKLAVASRFT